MDSEEKCEVYYLGEVRGNGNLLFKLAVVEGGICIILKRRGDARTYCIPVYFLLKPFVEDLEETKPCERLTENFHESTSKTKNK